MRVALVALVLLFCATGMAAEAMDTQADAPETVAQSDPLIHAIGQRMTGERNSPDAAAGASTPERSPFSFGAILARLIVALGITLGALYGVLLGLRRVMGKRALAASSHVRVLCKSSLSPKSSIYVVEAAGQVMVIGETPGSIALLTTITDQEAIERLGLNQSVEPSFMKPVPGKISMALDHFVGQLGVSSARLSSQSLSRQLQEGTRSARELARSLDRQARESSGETDQEEPAVKSFRATV